MTWHLVIDREVRKQLKRIPVQDAKRIISVIENLVINPYAGDIQKMASESKDDTWRRRIGSFRIFYEVRQSSRTIYVYDVKRRTSKTY